MEANTNISPLLSFGHLDALINDIDDWCGTKSCRPSSIRPHKVRDALIAVAIHNLAAQIGDKSIRDQIQAQADRLYSAAGKGISG